MGMSWSSASTSDLAPAAPYGCQTYVVHLQELVGELWISRLPADSSTVEGIDLVALPASHQAEFFSVTRTTDEVSIVASEPIPGGRVEGPWRGFRVVGTLDFALTGILHSLAEPLAAAEISVFAISTFDTDYLLVRADRVVDARSAWEQAGFTLT